MSRNSEAMRLLRLAWKLNGLCTRCGGEKPCQICRIKGEDYRKTRRNTTLTHQLSPADNST